MNPLFDALGFDPLEQIEQAAELLPLNSAIPLDPLGAMLDALESHIEQPPAPELDVFADPLARTLDQVESSAEGRGYGEPQLGGDPVHPVLDHMETETERQVIPPEAVPSHVDFGHPVAEGAGPPPVTGGGFPAGMGGSDVGPAPRGGNGPAYVYRPHGGRTGARMQADAVFCSLSRRWVDAEECRECPDFEPEDTSAGDDEERCRYASDDRD